MAEERIIVAYKVEVVVDKEGGFKEEEIDSIRKIAEEQIAKVEKGKWKYFEEKLVLLQLKLFVVFGWSKEEISKIRIEDIEVKQVKKEVKK